MDPLIETLTASGLLDRAATSWVQEYRQEFVCATDTALLDLDLIDEDGLLRGLSACSGLPPATAVDVATADATLRSLLVDGFGGATQACPVRIVGGRLVLLVTAPLAEEPLRELGALGLRATQLVAPEHYIALAKREVFGTPLDERNTRLEARLAQHRRADVRRTAAGIASAESRSAAAAELLNYASCLVDFACLLVTGRNELRVAAARGGTLAAGAVVPLPDPGCTVAAALRYGGYFVGHLTESEEDETFCRSLGRPVPRNAIVAPVPVPSGPPVALFADNGGRGLASRWVAEMTLLAVRVGQQAGLIATPKGRSHADVGTVGESPAASPAASLPSPSSRDLAAASNAERSPLEAERYANEANAGITDSETTRTAAADDASREPPLTAAERRALDRLRMAAGLQQKPIDILVDELLLERRPQPSPEVAVAVVGEMRELFEKLALSIPTQLARGLETAFRDMAPRLGPTDPGAAADLSRAPVSSASYLTLAAPGPREVDNYRNRRAKAKRIKT